MFLNNRRDKLVLLHSILFGFLLCFLTAFSSLADAQNRNYYKNPKVILDEVSKQGARTIVSELYNHPTEWNFVLQHIATGTKTWLKVAVALHPGSDAGASEMLTLSVGEALERSPSNVFKVALTEFQLEAICSGPDVDDERYNSYSLAIKAINQRQKSISAIAEPKLKIISTKCIQLLEEAKSGIAKFHKNVRMESGLTIDIYTYA
ncbi:MAG: hypothetical protein HZA10_10040 [Nitrospirae bacterium]|nr:hypothetical protein [Nitrospirota bacterium]